MNKNMWESVWRREEKYPSLIPTNELPWDIHTHDKNLEFVLKDLNLKSGKVLELGCGSGNDAKFLANAGFDVTAIDISEIAINIAKSNTVGLPINYICGDIEFDIPNTIYDFIYDRGCIHYCQDKLFNIFGNLKNILASGSKLILLTGNKNSKLYDIVSPTPMSLGDVEHHSYRWFKVKLVKEIIFEQNPHYGDSLGYLFVLEKR